LGSINIIGKYDSSLKNTRSRCTYIAALTLLSASLASGLKWTPKNMYSDASQMSSLAELARAVLEGEDIM
jgi:hypothetical protein